MADWLIRITQRWGGPNGIKWHTTYEATGSTLTSIAQVRPMADAIVRAHRAIQHTKVYIQSVGVATWQADSFPYDRNKFTNFPVGLFATRLVNGDHEPAEMCLKLSRNPASGRSGRVLLRGVLGENDVSSANTGAPELTNAGLANTTIPPISSYIFELSPFLATGSGANGFLAMIGRPKTSKPGVKPPTYGAPVAAVLQGFGYFGVGNVNMKRDNDGRVGTDVGDAAANKAVYAEGATTVIIPNEAAMAYVPNFEPDQGPEGPPL